MGFLILKTNKQGFKYLSAHLFGIQAKTQFTIRIVGAAINITLLSLHLGSQVFTLEVLEESFLVVPLSQKAVGPVAEQLHSVRNSRSQQTRHFFQEIVLVLRVHGFISVQLQGEGGVARCERSQYGGIAL